MRSIFVFLLMAAAGACQSKKQEQTASASAPALSPLAYDLAHPSRTFPLPASLKEISGITYVKDGQLACINDEDGDLFLFDYKSGKVTDRRMWGTPGDYEDLAYVDNTFYIMRSDGKLFVFPLSETIQAGDEDHKTTRSIRSFGLVLPGDKNELEGFCFDPKTKWFFVAAKNTKGGSGKPDTRYVYFYDRARNVSWKGIVLRKQSFEELGFTGKDATFNPSGIAVHPLTKHVYILASNGHKLIVLDRKGGQFVSVEKLDPSVFEQPEGICFAPDGTLFLSSEGKKNPGMIWAFKPR